MSDGDSSIEASTTDLSLFNQLRRKTLRSRQSQLRNSAKSKYPHTREWIITTTYKGQDAKSNITWDIPKENAPQPNYGHSFNASSQLFLKY